MRVGEDNVMIMQKRGEPRQDPETEKQKYGQQLSSDDHCRIVLRMTQVCRLKAGM